MNKERAIYFAGLMEEYLNIPSCVCENIENELINEKYNKVINYVIDRRKELENKANYKTHQEIINMYLELQQENEQLNILVNSCQEEIRQLKKQLENYKKLGFKHLKDKNNKLETRQKKFINYLENEIEKATTNPYTKLSEYGMNRIHIYKEILQKYKSIIGVSNENN